MPLNGGVTVGSNSAVSRQALAKFQGNNNAMLGFAAFENGFTLNNFATNCTFNSYYPVSGPINMNSGTLTLQQPLVFGGTATLATGGTFLGNGLSIDLPKISGSFSLPGNTTFDTTKLALHSNITLGGVISFSGSSVIEGNNYSIDLSGGSIVLAAGATLLIRDANLKNVSGTNIVCQSNTSTLTLQDVIWNQTGNYTFSAGAINIQNECTLVGTSSWIFAGNQAMTIKSNSNLMVSDNMIFDYAPSSTAQNLIVLTDYSSQITLQNSTVHTSTNLILTQGQLNVEGISYVTSDTTTIGLTFGDTTSAHDTILFIDSGAQLVFSASTFAYKNVSPSSLIFMSNLSQIYFGPNSKMHLYKSIVYPMGQLVFDYTSSQILEAGVTFTGSFLYL